MTYAQRVQQIVGVIHATPQRIQSALLKIVGGLPRQITQILKNRMDCAPVTLVPSLHGPDSLPCASGDSRIRNHQIRRQTHIHPLHIAAREQHRMLAGRGDGVQPGGIAVSDYFSLVGQCHQLVGARFDAAGIKHCADDGP